MRLMLAFALAMATTACAGLSALEREQASALAVAARSTTVDCDRADACARPSPLRELAVQAHAESTSQAPRHRVLLLEYGQDAMLARLDLIRGATRSIDLQTYIFDEDDAGHLFLDELLAAARRGVRVRLLVDQLSALRKVDTLAALAGAHANFEMRIYNPVLGRARISYPLYVAAAACCWRRLNQRMHSKLLLVDGIAGITGGRNYQDDYYDWDDTFNFRDRDVLVGGPVSADMAANFEAFWNSPLSVPAEQLNDVGRSLLRNGVPARAAQPYENPARVQAASRNADDTALVRDNLAAAALPVGRVGFFADLPSKHRRDRERAREAIQATPELLSLISGAEREVLLQTPYLVLSPGAQAVFRALRERAQPPRVVISTNSLAATDSFITYALSYKYKRRHLREFGFHIYEYKPFPEGAPIDLDATGAVDITFTPDGTASLVGRPAPVQEVVPAAPTGHKPGERRRSLEARRNQSAAERRQDKPAPLAREYAALRYAGIGVNRRVPLKRTGVRFGLHAKSMVVDERIGVVGTHNFDPRGDDYNTESAVVVEDAAFARALADMIRLDTEPENAWVIARRDRPLILPGVDYSLAKVSERLPVFDLWPTRYATSYAFKPGPDCPAPLPPDDPGFRACYTPVGDFPEVNIGFRTLLTRIFTAFGAGLSPIL